MAVVDVVVVGLARQVLGCDLDPDRLQVLRDDLRRGDPVRVAADVDHRERERLAVGRLIDAIGLLEAGLLQNLLGLRRVVADLLREPVVEPVAEGRRDDPRLVRRGLVAVLADLRDLRAVDPVRHRLPHGEIGEHRILLVDVDGDVDDGREPVMVVGALRGVELVDVRDELASPLRLAARQLLVRRIVRRERRVVDRVDRRLPGLPVARILLVLDHLRRARAHGVRAGPGRVIVLVGGGVLDR